MSPSVDDQSGLTDRLAALSSGDDLPRMELWKYALLASTQAEHGRRLKLKDLRSHGFPIVRVLSLPFRNLAAMLIVITVLMVAIGSLLPPLTHSRSSSRSTPGFYSMDEPADVSLRGAVVGKPPAAEKDAVFYSKMRGEDAEMRCRFSSDRADDRDKFQSANKGAARSVIHKATIELRTEDVRGVFHKVAMLINEGRGEFIEESSLSGETDQSPRAEIKIRVVADRLSEVMNELRQFGRVDIEKVVGDDVTDQLVDLDARLRNEQRVELELLDLLDTQKTAELSDILQLRGEIGKVRGEIERLLAQKSRVNGLVALSTILVIVRHEKLKDPAEEQDSGSIGDYFQASLANAWESSMLALADSIAWIVYVLLGGLIWWGTALTAILFAVIMYRRGKQSSAGT